MIAEDSTHSLKSQRRNCLYPSAQTKHTDMVSKQGRVPLSWGNQSAGEQAFANCQLARSKGPLHTSIPLLPNYKNVFSFYPPPLAKSRSVCF